MKFLVDKCLARSLVSVLERLGHEAFYGGDDVTTMGGDDDVLAYARVRGLVVLTLDKRFASDAGYAYANSPGIIVVDVGPYATPRAYEPLVRANLALTSEEFCRNSLVRLSERGLEKIRGVSRRVPSKSIDVEPFP